MIKIDETNILPAMIDLLADLSEEPYSKEKQSPRIELYLTCLDDLDRMGIDTERYCLIFEEINEYRSNRSRLYI